MGKTAGRSYKAAPRQLLQVDRDTASPELTGAHPSGHISKSDAKENLAGAAKEAAKIGREALGDQAEAVEQEPLTRRECLLILEGLYDSLLKLEQLRREQLNVDGEKMAEWEVNFAAEVQKLWDDLQIMVPLETR